MIEDNFIFGGKIFGCLSIQFMLWVNEMADQIEDFFIFGGKIFRYLSMMYC